MRRRLRAACCEPPQSQVQSQSAFSQFTQLTQLTNRSSGEDTTRDQSDFSTEVANSQFNFVDSKSSIFNKNAKARDQTLFAKPPSFGAGKSSMQGRPPLAPKQGASAVGSGDADLRPIHRRYKRKHGSSGGSSGGTGGSAWQRKETNKAEKQKFTLMARKDKMRERAIDTQGRHAKRSKVVMYRQYRKGELPDVQIKLSDLMGPLLGLCSKDPTIAKQLFVLMVFGISFQKSGGNKSNFDDAKVARIDVDGQSVDPYLKDLIDTLLQILQSAPNSNIVVASVLELFVMLVEFFEFSVPSDIIGMVSRSSGNFQLGIRLLEQMMFFILGKKKPVQGGRSGRGGSTALVSSDDEIELWKSISNLYFALNERDVLVDLLSKTGGGEHSRNIQLDMCMHNYITALKDLRKSGATTVVAKSQMIDCMWNLQQWSDLKDNCFEMAKTTVVYDDELDSDNCQPLSVEFWSKQQLGNSAFEAFLDCLVRGEVKYDTSDITAFVEKVSRPPSNLETPAVQDFKAWTQKELSTELALLWFSQDEFEKTSAVISHFYERFLLDWNELHPLAFPARQCKVQKLQAITDLRDFLSIQSDSSSGRMQYLQKATALIAKWRVRMPNCLLDPIPIWRRVHLTREKCLIRVESAILDYKANWKVARLPVAQRLFDNLHNEIDALRRQSRLEMCAAAAVQRDMEVAAVLNKQFKVGSVPSVQDVLFGDLVILALLPFFLPASVVGSVVGIYRCYALFFPR